MKRDPVTIGKRRTERADAVRNREHLLEVARSMVEESGADAVTMDGLAERAGLGKGTVFRRFKTRAGIFQALLDEDGRAIQESVLSGPAPLGPEAETFDRLVAYGHARVECLLRNHAVARASFNARQSEIEGNDDFSQLHIRSLLGQAKRDGQIDIADLDTLTIQLIGALDGPLILYLNTTPPNRSENKAVLKKLSASWTALVEHIFR
jgi:AcrR family transcriptional regulator